MRYSRALANYAKRRRRGSQIAEFGAALALITFIIIVPAVDLLILPVRWVMAQELLKSSVRQLSLCESFSQSIKYLEFEPSLAERLNAIGGIKVESVKMYLKASKIFQPGQSIVVEQAGQLSNEWLPSKGQSPCTYTLQLEAKVKLFPALLLPKTAQQVPFINGPVPTVLSASHEWENLSFNPESGNYFLNE